MSAGEYAKRLYSGEIPWLDDENKPLLLILPGLVAFLTFMFYPVLYTVYLSLTDARPSNLFNPERTIEFIGTANYQQILADPQFWNSVGVTWLFMAVSVLLKVLLGLGIALVLTHDRVRGKRFMRSLVIAPMGFPGIFTIVIWAGIFSPARFGLANQFIRWLGGVIPFFSGDSIAWMSERWMAFFAYIVTEVWLAYPFMVIITVSALQDVPEELHEAAVVDGAGAFARLLHVTLPSIKRPVLFATILTSAASFQQFLIPFVFNQGGPARANELLIVYGYREAFQFSAYGRGAAISIVAVVFIGAFMWLNVKRGKLADGVDDA
jgi:arabinogalactan oligomer/maltooligosaccharide transport system permease protein